MSPDDFIVRVCAEFLLRAVLALIQAVGTSDFAEDVTHALYDRLDRRGVLPALGSAVTSLWQALRARAGPSADPFAGVDWNSVLGAGPGVTAKRQHQDYALRNHIYYSFEKLQHAGTTDRRASAGGFFAGRGVTGCDRGSQQWVAAIPLQCGGTAGVLSVAVFVSQTDGAPKLVDVIQQGDKQLAFFSGGHLHVATPLRDPGEPNCSWRRTRVARYNVSSAGANKSDEAILTTKRFMRRYRGALARRLDISGGLPEHPGPTARE
jgi:hypothetical protein